MRGEAWAAVGLLLAAGVGFAGAGALPAVCATGPVPPLEEALAAVEGTPYTLVADARELPREAGQDDPVSLCSGKIRPGAVAVFNSSWLCTLNFIFKDSQGNLYVGTAGHCVPSAGAMTIRVPGVANDIGDPAYTTGDGGVGNDFALIRINAAYYSFVEPTMCRWGGPQQVNSQARQDAVLHFGWGVFWGDGPETRGRAAVISGNGFTPNYVSFRALAGPGDSGSPIEMRDGKALGVLTHGSAGGFPWLGTIWATRVDRGLALAGGRYTLVDSPVPVDLTGVTVPE